MSAILACAYKDPPVPKYSKEDYERIAKAIGKSTAEVLQHENEFEDAATWYLLNIPPAKREEKSSLELLKQRSEKPKKLSKLRKQRSRKPKTLSELRKKAKQIEGAARKLLIHLGVYHCREALDGPGGRDLLIFLASYSGGTEEEVTQATARVGRLAELLKAIDAAKFLQVCADKAAQEAVNFSKLLPWGHHGDIAANEWIAAMMPLYKRIDRQRAWHLGAPARIRPRPTRRSISSLLGSFRRATKDQAESCVLAKPAPRPQKSCQ